MKQTGRNWQADLKVFRERMGGVTDEKKAWVKRQNEELKAIRKSLQEGHRTVPALARETGLNSRDVMWYVMAMKRYGEVAETGRQGHYLLYGLKEPLQ